MDRKRMESLGKKRSVIRELFEYGNKRKAEIGDENVFDFSIGNPKRARAQGGGGRACAPFDRAEPC